MFAIIGTGVAFLLLMNLIIGVRRKLRRKETLRYFGLQKEKK